MLIHIQAHGVHHLVHAPREDAVDPGFLDQFHQGLLGGLPGLQEGQEATALPQLRDPQLRRPQARVQRPVADAVAVFSRSPVSSCRPGPIRPSISASNSVGSTASAMPRRKSLCPVFASRPASGNLSSVFHPSRQVRWSPKPYAPAQAGISTTSADGTLGVAGSLWGAP